MSTEPVVRTERLELWRPQPDDLASLVELIAAEETRRFLGPSQPDAKSQFDRLLRQAGSWSFYGYGGFQLRRPGERAIVGSCGVFHSWRGFAKGMDDVPEAGWIIRSDHWGKGCAGEAMRAILAWFDSAQGGRRIAAMIQDGNTASQRVAAALGFAEYARHDYERLP